MADSTYQIGAQFDVSVLGGSSLNNLQRATVGIQSGAVGVGSKFRAAGAFAAQSANTARQAWTGLGATAAKTALALGVTASVGGLWIAKGIELNKVYQNQGTALGSMLDAFGKYGDANAKALNPQQKFNQALFVGNQMLKSFEGIAAKAVGETKDYIEVAQTIGSGVFASGKGTSGLETATQKLIAVAAIIKEDFPQAGRDLAVMLGGSLQQDQLLYSRALKPFIQPQIDAMNKIAEEAFKPSKAQKKFKTLTFIDIAPTERYNILMGALEKFATPAALAKIGVSFDAASSTASDFFDRFNRRTTAPIFGVLTRRLNEFNGLTAKNADSVGKMADRVGLQIAGSFDAGISSASKFIQFIDTNQSNIKAFGDGFASSIGGAFKIARDTAQGAYDITHKFLELTGQLPKNTPIPTGPHQARTQAARDKQSAEKTGAILGGGTAVIGGLLTAGLLNKLLGGIPGKAIGGGLGGLFKMLTGAGGKGVGGLPNIGGAGIPVFVTNMGAGGLGGGLPGAAKTPGARGFTLPKIPAALAGVGIIGGGLALTYVLMQDAAKKNKEFKAREAAQNNAWSKRFADAAIQDAWKGVKLPSFASYANTGPVKPVPQQKQPPTKPPVIKVPVLPPPQIHIQVTASGTDAAQVVAQLQASIPAAVKPLVQASMNQATATLQRRLDGGLSALAALSPSWAVPIPPTKAGKP
jgi:type II secretory pathway pseudopilin PulG